MVAASLSPNAYENTVMPRNFDSTGASFISRSMVPLRTRREPQDSRRRITCLAGLVSSNGKVTLVIEADIPAGAPDLVVRTATENSCTLKLNRPAFTTVCPRRRSLLS